MDNPNHQSDSRSFWPVFLIFLKLGLTSFGGPIAHLGYFRAEFVVRRQWLSERSYADLVALCQFLPGPASSQVGIALGLSRSGYSGALAAWLGFTLPSALALILFAQSIVSYGSIMPASVLHGLKILAVAVVAQAVWGMARAFCTDTARITIMVCTACVALITPTAAGQLALIMLAGVMGRLLLKPTPGDAQDALPIKISMRAGMLSLILFFALLLGLPLCAPWSGNQVVAMVDVFYRAGALVFGGGHVVLPLLQAEVVPSGWIGSDVFLAGYGAAQAVPGPLFTFASFLGASMTTPPTGWIGGVICLLAIFSPSFLLLVGALPFWERVRRNRPMQAALSGINAAVVGLLLAALYQPLWTSAILSAQDFGLALLVVIALMFWKIPTWLVVMGSSLTAYLLSTFI